MTDLLEIYLRKLKDTDELAIVERFEIHNLLEELQHWRTGLKTLLQKKGASFDYLFALNDLENFVGAKR